MTTMSRRKLGRGTGRGTGTGKGKGKGRGRKRMKLIDLSKEKMPGRGASPQINQSPGPSMSMG